MNKPHTLKKIISDNFLRGMFAGINPSNLQDFLELSNIAAIPVPYFPEDLFHVLLFLNCLSACRQASTDINCTVAARSDCAKY